MNYTLTFPKGNDSNTVRSISQAFALSPSERLFKVFTNAVLFRYVALANFGSNYTSDEVYNKHPLSFLFDVRKDWISVLNTLTDEEVLKESPESFSRFFFVDAATVAPYLPIIRETAKALFYGTPLKYALDYNEEIVTLFRWNSDSICNFARVMVRDTIPETLFIGTSFFEYFTMPVCVVSRSGYSLNCYFYDALKTKYNRPNPNTTFIQFIKGYYFEDQISDNYLKLILMGVCYKEYNSTHTLGRLSDRIRQVMIGPIQSETVNELLRYEKTADQDTLNDLYQVGQKLVEVLGEINSAQPLVVGPITAAMFNIIRTLKDRELDFCIDRLTGQRTTVAEGLEAFETAMGIVKKPLELLTGNEYNPKHILYSPMQFKKYDFELLKSEDEDPLEIEPVEEDIPEEEVPDNPSPKNVPEIPPEEPEEKPEENPGEPIKEEIPDKQNPTLLVKVPEGSYLLKIRDSNITSLHEWIFLLEVDQLIQQTLEQFSEQLTDAQKTVLTRLRQEYLYCLDVESVESILTAIFKFVPKAPKTE